MNEPEKKAPVFGSEVLRLETPEHRKHRRRRGFYATLLGVVMSVNLIYFGIDSMLTGKWVYFHKSLTELPGWLVLLMGVVMLGFCLWQIARLAVGKD
jgi:hypothetical protein